MENIKAAWCCVSLRGIHRFPVVYLHKEPVMRKLNPWYDVIMFLSTLFSICQCFYFALLLFFSILSLDPIDSYGLLAYIPQSYINDTVITVPWILDSSTRLITCDYLVCKEYNFYFRFLQENVSPERPLRSCILLPSPIIGLWGIYRLLPWLRKGYDVSAGLADWRPQRQMQPRVQYQR